jgi:alanine-synthesizing transaminase
LCDEVYDRIVYDGGVHHHLAALARDVLCLTMSGLSKSHRVAGFRTGWLVVSGPRQHARDYLEGLTMLAGMRLCPNGPAQSVIEAALADSSLDALVSPGGRLHEQRDTAWRALNAIPGVSCVKPAAALYAFPRIDPEVHEIVDDERFVLDLLLQEKIHVVQGTGFNWAQPDHFRVVTLPEAGELETAIATIGRFLQTYRQ